MVDPIPPATGTPPAGTPTPVPTPTPEPTPTPTPGQTEIVLKMPEGSKLEAKRLDEIVAFSKEQGLSQKAAEAILKRESDNFSSLEAAKEVQKQQLETQQKEELKKTTDAWFEEAKADKEYGGEAFPKNIELAKRVVDRFGSPELKVAMEATGLGNHPELLRIFHRIGKAMSEDQLVLPGANAADKPKSASEILYPSQGS